MTTSNKSLLEKAQEATQQAVEKLDNGNVDLKDGLVSLQVKITGFSGAKVVPQADMILDGEKLKSEHRQNGGLKIYPTDKISFRSMYAKRINEHLLDYGFQDGDSIVIAATQLENAIEYVERQQAEFEQKVLERTLSYDSDMQDFKNSRPEVAKLIDKHCLTQSEFEARFKFDIKTPRMFASFLGDDDAMVEDAKQNVITEVAKKATAIFKGSLIGAEKITSKKFTPVLELRQKLINLSVAVPSLFKIADKFDDLLNSLPNSYPITGHKVGEICSFVSTISNEQILEAWANGETSNDDSELSDNIETPVDLLATALGETEKPNEIQKETINDVLATPVDVPAEVLPEVLVEDEVIESVSVTEIAQQSPRQQVTFSLDGF